MPTVHREGAFRFSIYLNDHGAPHVHAYNSDGMCIVEIATGHVRNVDGMRAPDVAAAQGIVTRNEHKLLAAWRRIHGV
jgi:uncharacterized protein DUF4160